MNKIQKTVISVAVPVIVILIGFVLIGYSGSYTYGYGDNTGVAFNPVRYFSKHGIEWSVIILLISIFEFFWWKTPKEKTNKHITNCST